MHIYLINLEKNVMKVGVEEIMGFKGIDLYSVYALNNS